MIVESKQGPNLISVQHISALSEIKACDKSDLFSPRKEFLSAIFPVIDPRNTAEVTVINLFAVTCIPASGEQL